MDRLIMLPGDRGFREILSTPPPNVKQKSLDGNNLGLVGRGNYCLLDWVNESELETFIEEEFDEEDAN